MKIKTSKKLNIFFMILIITVIALLGYLGYHKLQPLAYNSTTNFNYKEYVQIKMENSEIVYGHTNTENIKEEDRCSLIYKIYIKNISDKKIKVDHYKFTIPEQLTKSIIDSRKDFDSKEDDFELNLNQGLHIDQGVTMRNFNDLSADEKKLFNEYKNKLDLELIINGNKVHINVYPGLAD